MKEITAINFIIAWNHFIRKFEIGNGEFDVKKYGEKWKSNKIWTLEIIGNNRYGEDNSPLGDKLKDFFDGGIEYRKEYYKIDLLLAKRNDFSFKAMNNKKIESKYGFYPKTTDIIIEHENNIKTCWEEMTKLTSYKARLKVLITYNYFEREEGASWEYYTGLQKIILKTLLIMQTRKLRRIDELNMYLL